MSVPQTPSLRHIPSLDGIRAVSFLVVFVAHCGLEWVIPGGLGVTIFFFLSGYLITTLMRAEFEKNRAVNLQHFWLRRALRILPPFYVVLTAAALLTYWTEPAGTLHLPALTAQALHVSNYWLIYRGYDGQPVGTGVYWSLAVEEHFYLLFPWIYLAMQRAHLTGRQQSFLLWFLCLVVFLWRCVLVLHYQVPTDRTYLASDTRVDSILFGCALAVWNNPVLDKMELDERRWKFWIVPAALVLFLACLLYRNPVFRETARYSLQGVALTAIFIGAVRFPHWLPYRILNWRPVAFLGALSYSLYLLHFTVIIELSRMRGDWNPVLRSATAFALAVAIAWLIYLFVEKPCARLRRSLTD